MIPASLIFNAPRALLARYGPGFTAAWLIAQFVLLVIVFHAGPWPWASRSLSMLGAIIPAWALLLHASVEEHEFTAGALLLTTFLVLIAGVINIATPLDASSYDVIGAYRIYFLVYVIAQVMLVICWLVFWWRRGPGEAFGGAVCAALGIHIAVEIYRSRPVSDVLTMPPWRYMWAPDAGAIDAASRVDRPELVFYEIMGLGGASIALAVLAWRK